MSVDFLHRLNVDLLQKSSGIADIAYIGGTTHMVDDLVCIAKNYRGILVLTLGAEGSMAFEGDRVYTQKALPIRKVLDTTGCGEAAMSFGGIPWE